MKTYQQLSGVYTALLTPLSEDYSLALDDLPPLLEFLAERGSHGALLLGTTGEGPSFSAEERIAIWKKAADFKNSQPDFRLLAGAGTPSLSETIQLTRAAFDLGLDGVVVLPPYYFRQASQEGLYTWFSQILEQAVPQNGAFFGYHIPAISGVPLSLDLVERLKNTYPERFAGIKDSSSNPQHAQALGERFGKDLIVFNGNDKLFNYALQNSASGCITAMANIVSPALRQVWDAHLGGELAGNAQPKLEAARAIFEKFPPAPPLLKALLSRQFGFPRWAVRPPLMPISPDLDNHAFEEASSNLFTSTG